jgi:hypothetical protein
MEMKKLVIGIIQNYQMTDDNAKNPPYIEMVLRFKVEFNPALLGVSIFL